MNALSVFAILLGLFFLGVGTLGVLRFPDIFTRVHASSKADTLGISLIVIGLALSHGLHLDSFKLLLIPAFMWMANPVANHLLARAAWKRGVKPWRRAESAPPKTGGPR